MSSRWMEETREKVSVLLSGEGAMKVEKPSLHHIIFKVVAGD